MSTNGLFYNAKERGVDKDLQQGWNYTLMWYINDAKAATSFSFFDSADSASTNQRNEDFEAREKLLKEREEKIEAAENEAVEREKAVAERESKAEARQKAISGVERAMKQRGQDSEVREKALDERTRKLEAREQAVAGKESGASGSSEEAGQVAELQRQLADTQRELDEAKAVQQSQAEQLNQGDIAQSHAAPSTNDSSLGATDDETTKLRQRIQELEGQLAGTTPSLPTKPNGSVERERQGLKPIVVQQGFGFLPRLSDSKVRAPLPTNQPPTLLPRKDLPPKLNPPAIPPSMTSVR